MGSIPFHPAIEEGEKGIVAPHTDVLTWVEFGPPLPQDNIPAKTVSPSYFFTPNLLPALSRPFLEVPCPFLCAILFDPLYD